jgi:hypothetical protein
MAMMVPQVGIASFPLRSSQTLTKMNKTFWTWPLLALMIFTAWSLGGCSKYDDGPRFSLRSKKERVTNNWVATRVFRNDIEETNFYFLYGMEFQRNGGFIWRIDRNDDNLDLAERAGTWQLTAANTQIEITFLEADPDTDQEKLFLTIRRLAEDELWVSFIYRGDTYDLQFQ